MSKRGLLLFALLSLLWGIPYLMIKIAVAEVSVPFLVFARSAVGALVLLPFAFRGGGFKGLNGHWPAIAAFAAVEMMVPWGLLVHAETQLSSAMSGLLVAATPIITIIFARLLGKGEAFKHQQLIGLNLGFIGVFVLALPALGGNLGSMLEVLLAAACYAAGSLIAARWLKDVPAVPMTVACLALAALAYLPWALAGWPNAMPSSRAIVAISGLGMACTALAFASFFMLIREVGPERAVVVTYVAPAVAVTAGFLLLAEPVQSQILIAFPLILCGSYLATARFGQQSIIADRVPERS